MPKNAIELGKNSAAERSRLQNADVPTCNGSRVSPTAYEHNASR